MILALFSPRATRRCPVTTGRSFADFVANVFESLRPEEKVHATICVRSSGYGPAAAIDFFGRGPGDGDGKAVIVVGGKPKWVSTLLEEFDQVATFECRYRRPDENHTDRAVLRMSWGCYR